MNHFQPPRKYEYNEINKDNTLYKTGPGDPHNYLLPLKQLACTGRKIIFYDQVLRRIFFNI